jgi:hypothetical protein
LRERLARGERGQSLVEMTIGFIVLLIIASGVLDLGRAYFTYVSLEDGAGEAALYGAINPSCLVESGSTSDGVCDCDPGNDVYENAECRAQYSGGGVIPGSQSLVDWSAATMSVTCSASPCELGDTITATIDYQFELLTPVIPDIAGTSTLTLTAHATQSVIGEGD